MNLTDAALAARHSPTLLRCGLELRLATCLRAVLGLIGALQLALGLSRSAMLPARSAYLLGLNLGTIHRVLTHHRVPQLAHLDRGTRQPNRRYEHPEPGDPIHVDSRKLGNTPDGGSGANIGRSMT
ncbi:hypothetical protein [Micromonospora sp. NPDC047074]|uniref:hypothetical protein n=1 Tax=Micromonospora sp. NPDC047074 TaxID=3154339 RepID=UPI0033D6EEF0